MGKARDLPFSCLRQGCKAVSGVSLPSTRGDREHGATCLLSCPHSCFQMQKWRHSRLHGAAGQTPAPIPASSPRSLHDNNNCNKADGDGRDGPCSSPPSRSPRCVAATVLSATFTLNFLFSECSYSSGSVEFDVSFYDVHIQKANLGLSVTSNLLYCPSSPGLVLPSPPPAVPALPVCFRCVGSRLFWDLLLLPLYFRL